MDSSIRAALLVGSVPLHDSTEVFVMAGKLLGESLKSIPDGETGIRKNWILWQKRVLEEASFLEAVEQVGDYGTVGANSYRLVNGTIPAGAAFGKLGYADAAKQSYAIFKTLRDAGKLPKHVRFQVSLPTPLAPLAMSIHPVDFLKVEPLYTEAMQREVADICAAVPAQDLAIQWDVAVEIGLLEGIMKGPVDTFDPLLQRITETARWVPDNVRLGYHFCYGDAGHKHFKEPSDSGLMVKLANALFTKLTRKIDWIHMPVPKARIDADYYAPLAGLKLPADCELYLGLIHKTDGIPGAKRRIDAASRFAPAFGVATECGWGRRPPETIPELMRLTAEVTKI